MFHCYWHIFETRKLWKCSLTRKLKATQNVSVYIGTSATRGCTQTCDPFVYAPCVYWNMVVYQNVTPPAKQPWTLICHCYKNTKKLNCQHIIFWRKGEDVDKRGLELCSYSASALMLALTLWIGPERNWFFNTSADADVQAWYEWCDLFPSDTASVNAEDRCE